MIEVFTTSIENDIQSEDIIKLLKLHYPTSKINFDLNETGLAYPCGHTILRIEDESIQPERIISLLLDCGFSCDILDDKICIDRDIDHLIMPKNHHGN